MIKIIEKNINDLIDYEKNARINDKAVEFVANSIREFGFKNPIIIDKQNVIIAGHTRRKACEVLGIDKAPCIVADDLSEEQIKAFRIADNSTAQIAEWDLEKLQAEIDGIDMDMLLYGCDEQLKAIESIIEKNKEAEEDEYQVDENIELRVKTGEIWQLGEHRLMCADSTKEEDVAELMNGELADLVVTDPPYNVDYNNKEEFILKYKPNKRVEDKKLINIENDKMSDLEFINFLCAAFRNMKNNLKSGGSFYIWHADTQRFNFLKALEENQINIRQVLIWKKNHFVFSRQDYQWKHEPYLYGWKDGASHYFIDDRTQTTIIEDKGIDFKKLKKDEAIAMLKEIHSDKISTTIINEDKPVRNDLHPTMKPLKLIGRQIKNSSRLNEIVLDLFGGSGPTLLACEQLDRKCYMMEFDPKYATVIVDRWEKFTGKKAKKIKGE